MITCGTSGLVFDIQRFVLHDGPGVRSLVFLKGCSLKCLWCDNPESIEPHPEIGLMRFRCNKCGKCFTACPEDAILLDSEGMPRLARDKCTNCGQCVKVCGPSALILYGEERSVLDVFEEVKRDKIFYESSGGGVTVSGGEPLLQPSFVKALFEICRDAKIHTSLETAGFANRQVLEEVLPLTDYVLYDLKHLDSGYHEKFTGRSNGLILENARIVAKSGVPVLFRCPLIPGINDTNENVEQTANFLRAISRGEATIQLLPYHRLGEAKYRVLDKHYAMQRIEPSEPSQVESIRRMYEDMGVKCSVS